MTTEDIQTKKVFYSSRFGENKFITRFNSKKNLLDEKFISGFNSLENKKNPKSKEKDG